MKNKKRILSLLLTFTLLILGIGGIIVYASNAENTESAYSADTDYSPTVMWNIDYESGTAKKLNNIANQPTYSYYHAIGADGNTFYSYAPGMTGTPENHVHLSYRSDVKNSDQVIYVGDPTAESLGALEQGATKSFVTLDFDIAAEGGIPEDMSVSLNARYFTSAATESDTTLANSSPAGNCFIYMRDGSGTLEINTKSGYVDTGIDIAEEFAHITLVLDLRDVLAGGTPSAINAYVYANGNYIGALDHGFSSKTDIINEIRVELNANKAVSDINDVIAVDNILMRSFDNAEYTGNLGGVVEDSAKTLADFDCNIFTEDYTLPLHRGTIAKIGTKNYTSLKSLANDVKVTDVVRFLVPKAELSLTAAETIEAACSAVHYPDSETGIQDDGVLYEVFSASGALLTSYTADTDDFAAACQALQITGGTIELYSDVTSSSRIFSSTTANDGTLLSGTTTKVTFSFNGNTLTQAYDTSDSNWFNIVTANGKKELTFEGPGLLTSSYRKMFQIGAGAQGSHITFKNLDILVPSALITGQKGMYDFENCSIAWTDAGNVATSNLIYNFGGPTRSYQDYVYFKNCEINYEQGADYATRGVLINTNTIADKASDDPGITTIVTFDGCEVNMPNAYILFSNWNTSHQYNTGRPAPELRIIDSTVTACGLATANRGSKPTVTTEGHTTLNLEKLGSASGTTDNSTVAYNSEIEINFGLDTVINITPTATSLIAVNLAGKLLSLSDGTGYIVKTPKAKVNMSLNDDFNFNFYIPKSEFVSAVSDGTPLTLGDEVTIGDVTYITVSYDNIAPALADTSISAAITLTNGYYEYTANYSISIPKYIKAVLSLENDDSVRARELMAAVVNYIDAAHTHFAPDTESADISELSELVSDIAVTKVDISSLEAINTMSNLSEYLTEAYMSIESVPKLRFTIADNFSGTVTVNGAEYTVENGLCGGNNYIETDLRARNVANTVTVNVGGLTGKYNIVSYYNHLVSAGESSAAAVLEALFAYGNASKSYKAHIYSEDYTYNETHHWHKCNDTTCADTTEKELHSYGDDGFCVCGQIYNFTDGEGEFLVALGINDNMATGRDDMKFAKVLENSSVTYSFTDEDKATVSDGDMLLFSFVVKSPVSTPLNITVDVGTVINNENNSKTMEYFSPAQWTRIYMPITNNGMASVTLSTSGTVYIAEAKYENRTSATHDDLQLESGMWMLDEFDYIDISDNGLGVGKTIDLVKNGNYIYSIGGGKFSVTDVVSNTVVGTIDGFGTLRQIDITEDGKHVVITGRQDGVYIVNVEDPAVPAIVSTYNSIEMATGLYISGKYAFICNRQYGVEVVDISDPQNPAHLVNIHSGEVQSCVVYNNILYAGVWSECGVYMYDLSNLTDSSFLEPIGTVTTDGKGDGMSVMEIDGRVYLFAATGQHTYSASTSSPLQNLAYGQGNGLDIYDVTDPANATWVSTSKIDGRYYYTGNDYWEAEVGYDEESGRYLAYLVNTYNGVYVFDVSDLSAPVRLAQITVPLTAGSTPALTSASRKIITTWDQTKEKRSPIGAIIIEDGKLYVAGADSDLYTYESGLILPHKETTGITASFDNCKDSFYDFDNTLSGGTVTSLNDGSYKLYDTAGQVLGVATNGNYVYVAAGADGVKILDKTTLSLLGTISPTSISGRVGFANDVKVYNNTLYVASDIAGLIVYDITENLTEGEANHAAAPSLLWNYRENSVIARQITVSPDGLFTVVQINIASVWVINNSTHAKTSTLSASGGTMYHHNLSTVIADRYICFWNHVSIEYWMDFGPAGERYEAPVVLDSFTGGMGMRNGVCEITVDGVKYALKIQGSSAVYTNDFTSKNGTVISGISAIGKPTICGNYLFISERIGSTVEIYDISDLSNAVCIGTITFDGSPDVIHTEGTLVYIPLGYQGMLVIDTATAFSASSAS